MSGDLVIEWPGVDCEALRGLGARHRWCIPLSVLRKLPLEVYGEFIRRISELEIIHECLEYTCIDQRHIKCMNYGTYICAEINRELRPLIIKALTVEG